MSELSVIYDATLAANSVNTSIEFSNGKFVYFTCSSLSVNEVAEIGISCIARLPSLSGTVDKLWVELGTAFTDTLIPLPSEIADFNFTFYLAFSTEFSLDGFRAYVVTSTTTLESLEAQITSLINAQAAESTVTNAIAANEVLQNSALSLLGTGLIPITGGVTSAIPALLAPANIPLLLP